MEDGDEDGSEPDAQAHSAAQVHDGTEQLQEEEEREATAANRNRDQSPRDQGQKGRSRSHSGESAVRNHVTGNGNGGDSKDEPIGSGGKENGLGESDGQSQEQGGKSQGHFLKENVFIDSEGIQGKITNQSVVVTEDEILDNNVDGANDTASVRMLEGGAPIDQS